MIHSVSIATDDDNSVMGELIVSTNALIMHFSVIQGTD